MTVPEVRRLLLLLAEPEDAAREQGLHWSQWRRRHQATARQGHGARRAKRRPPANPGLPSPGPIRVLVVPGTAALSEALWQQIAPLVTPVKPLRGRPPGDLRRQLEGMLAVMHTGAPWREVSAAYGPWQTIYARHRDWVKRGLWERIAALLHPDPTPDQPTAPP